MSENKIKFFLGSNTRRGFIPLFDEIRRPADGRRLYLLKGGPGSGKSTLMRRVAKALENEGHSIEYIQCASDPHSLDAVLDHTSGISLADGTAPHILDPEYPGAYDVIINMGDIWNQDMLTESREDIIRLSSIIGKCHSMAAACITSAYALLNNRMELAEPYVHKEVIKEAYYRIIHELEGSPDGIEKKRLLSAVSVGKVEFFHDTIYALCSRVYSVRDDYGAASAMLLDMLHDYALLKGLDVITCYCSIRIPDKIDHLIFPSAGLAVTTSNTFHSCPADELIPETELIHPIEYNIASRLQSHLSMAEKLIDTACSHVAAAKALHDDLEAYYVRAMNFSLVDRIYDRLMQEILA